MVDCLGQIGSGSLPEQRLASIAVRINHQSESEIRDLQRTMRQLSTPVIARLQQGSLWLDMRGAERIDELAANLTQLSLGS